MKLLIKQEFIRNFKSLILWTVIITGLSFLMLVIYPAFENSMEGIEEMISSFPDAFLNIFNLGDDGLSFSNPYGWYGMEAYLFVTLIGASYASILGASILSKEEDDKTIEFLLSRPISRNKVIISKIIVILINIIILNFVLFVFNLIGFLLIDQILLKTLLLISFGVVLMQMIFAATSLMIGVFIIKSRSVVSIAMGLVMGMFFIDIIATITARLSFLKYVTPFEYVNATSIIKDNQIRPIYIVLSLLILLITTTITFIIYNKKDIKV